MPAYSDLVLRERTGQRRELRLRGPALPHGSIPFPVQTRQHTEAYQGTVHATQQVFGGGYAPIAIRGVWRDYHLRGAAAGDTGAVTWAGQTLQSAWDTMQAVLTLWLSGQELEIGWEGLRFRGMIGEFTPSLERREDIEWSLSFVVGGPGDEAVNQYTSQVDPGGEASGLLAGISAFLSTVTGALKKVKRVEAAINGYLDRVDLLRRQLEYTIELTGEVAMTPARIASRVMQSAEDLTGIYAAVRRTVEAADHTALGTETSAASLFAAYTAQRDIALVARSQAAAAARARARARAAVEQEVKAIVRVTEAQDLRRIALQQYGSADRWRDIAAYNGIQGSRVEPGTIVLVPA